MSRPTPLIAALPIGCGRIASVLASLVLLALAGIMGADLWVLPEPLLTTRMSEDLLVLLQRLRGGPVGLSPTDLLTAVFSLHVMTGLFILVVTLLGGRRSATAAFQATTPWLVLWAGGCAGALYWQGKPVLALALGGGLGICAVCNTMGWLAACLVGRSRKRRLEAQTAARKEARRDAREAARSEPAPEASEPSPPQPEAEGEHVEGA